MAEQERHEVRQSVLLIDGEVLSRHELAEFLRHCGYRVIEATSTDEAVTVLEQAPDRIDAVMCEVTAAGRMNCFALASWVREHRPGLPVLLARGPEHAAEAAGELCDEGPLDSRPYDHALVIDRIRRSLAARERNRG